MLYDELLEKLHGHKYGGYFTAQCVFHSDSNPSMFVYEDSGTFRCTSCGARGNLQKLAKRLNMPGVRVAQKVDTVSPRWKEWGDRWGDLAGIAQHAHQSIKRFPQWGFYFRQRKIDQFYEQGYFGYIDGWATFPVFDEHRKIKNIVLRHCKNKARYTIKHIEDAAPLLYVPNWERVKNSDTVYVPYGIIDAWAFEAIGLASVTGITGKSLSPELLQPLNKNFVIVPDEWEEQEAHNLANRLGWRARVKRLAYPEGVKDPDGVRTKLGNEYLLGALA
jgi:DNA primase